MPAPSALAVVYCTNEVIAQECPDDFEALCPAGQTLGSGSDGAFAADAPWVLTSASNNFATAGVASGDVVVLRKAGNSTGRGSGELFAVESVTGGACTLRRVYQAAGAGFPPFAGVATNTVSFTFPDFGPQIEEASFELNRRFQIDPNIPGRTPTDLYDLRDLRRACALDVVRRRYIAANRSERGDWPGKIRNLDWELRAVYDRLSLRWGTSGDDSRSTTRFSTRLTR